MFRLFKKKKQVKDQQQAGDKIEESLDQSSTQETDTLLETDTAPEKTDDADPHNMDKRLDDNHEDQTEPLEPPHSGEVPTETQQTVENIANNTASPSESKPETENKEKKGLFKRLRSGLSKTSTNLTEGISSLVLGKKKIDDEALEELETRLLMADVGIDATQRIIEDLTKRSSRNELNDVDALMKALFEEMTQILQPISKPLEIDSNNKPTVILMVGINGAGKTTTIGKLAKKFQNEGKSVMLAAGDTFRAAAVEQLQVWGERNNIPVVAQGTGSDSASVIYDAMESAKAKNIDVLLADTAGRLHTQTNLMEELKKVKRVMQKIDPSSPHEVMLIVDASIGQNALAQAKEFNNALGLTGITVTKLDGTAKGGILFAMAEQTGIPVRYVGVGESIDDLQEFDANEFTSALLNSNNK